VSGSASGASVSLGDTSGSPALTGQASGASESTGTASGSPDVPPDPAPPEPEVIVGGGPRFFIPQPPRPPRPQLVATHREGVARGYNRARGRATGAVGQTGAARGFAISTGLCAGARWPDDRELTRRRRVKDESELLTLLEM
jgi:hypothetical protein